MKQAVWSETYKVNSFLINLRGRAGLYALLNMVQDAGWLHAAHLGLNLAGEQSWVLTRQKLVMSYWPKWNETVTIKTWIRPLSSKMFSSRDYEIFVGDKKAGEGTSTFALFDTVNRKIISLDKLTSDVVTRKEGFLNLEPEKIQVQGDMEDLEQFQVRNSDIDSNNHVNNTRYAQWILDALPIDILRAGVELHEYEVNFLAETKKGDIVTVKKALTALQDGERTKNLFQGVRQSDGKASFVAVLTTTEVK